MEKKIRYPGGKSIAFHQGQLGSHICNPVFNWWELGFCLLWLLHQRWLSCGGLVVFIPSSTCCHGVLPWKDRHVRKRAEEASGFLASCVSFFGIWWYFSVLFFNTCSSDSNLISEIQHFLFAYHKSPSFAGSFQPNKAIHNEVKRGTWIQVVWPNAYPSICAVSSHTISQGQIAIGQEEIILSQKRRDLG